MTGEPPKNKQRGTPGFLIKFLQLALYILIQVAFLPIAIVGLIDALLKEMIYSKKLGVSFTAIQALQYRWIMHYFDTRPDSTGLSSGRRSTTEPQRRSAWNGRLARSG